MKIGRSFELVYVLAVIPLVRNVRNVRNFMNLSEIVRIDRIFYKKNVRNVRIFNEKMSEVSDKFSEISLFQKIRLRLRLRRFFILH